jgi:outer membrane protein assembly factor BamB
MLRRLFLVFILVSTFAVMGCKISGIITHNGAGLEGVTVGLSGDASMSTTTDANGTYVFDGLNQGTYTITPANAGYTFNPVSRDVTVGYADVVGADFVAVGSSLPQWSTYQGNAAHTGYVPISLNPENFSEGWTRDVIEAVPLNPVTAGDGKVFVTTVGYFGPNVAMALDSATGDTLWEYDFGDIHSIHPPAYAKGSVYIQSAGQLDSFLWAFDAESGELLFKTAYGNQWDRYFAPTIYDDNVYAGGGYYGGAYGFNAASGEELWHVELNQCDQWTPAVNEEHVIAYTGLYDYDLYSDSQLTVINRLTGVVDFIIPDPNFKWNGGIMDLAPVLGSQNNVIAIRNGRIINFDLATRVIGWEIPKKEEEEGAFSGQPSLAKGIIYAVYEGYLHARNESDGSFIWEWPPPDESIDESIDAPMIVTDNLIFMSTASTTYAVDLASHTQRWSYPSGGQLALSDEGVLFIATTEGNLITIYTD